MSEGKVSLNVENFISEIKKMSDRDRNKLRATELIKLIIQLPDIQSKDSKLDELSTKVKGLIACIQNADSRSENNAALIINLEVSEAVNQLKIQLNTCKEQVGNTEQYLRFNNIEIVALPPMESQNEEDLIIEAMNNLGDINISSDDIDISHSIPTKRRDGKSVCC